MPDPRTPHAPDLDLYDMEPTKTTMTLADEKLAESISAVVDIDTSSETFYVDPEKEKSALKKFDRIFLPQAFIFLLLNYLDRSNLGPYPPSLLPSSTNNYQEMLVSSVLMKILA